LKKIDYQDNYRFITDSQFFKNELMSMPGLNTLTDQESNFDFLYNSLTNNNYSKFLRFSNNSNYKDYFYYNFLFLFSDKYSIPEIKKIAKFYGIEYTDEDYEAIYSEERESWLDYYAILTSEDDLDESELILDYVVEDEAGIEG
jgi:hypothetical protein